MKRLYYPLIVVIAVAGVWLAYRYVRHEQARRLALPVIAELGGRVGSITAPLGGTEYVISFPGRALTRSDIDRLVVLGALTDCGNDVLLYLHDNTISAADLVYLEQVLPQVRVALPDSDDPAAASAPPHLPLSAPNTLSAKSR